MFILATSLSSQVNPDWRTYVMLAAYFFILLIIGYYGYKQATGDLSEYMLGGRNIGPYVTALSAGASDMSGWMIMGLPGEVYTTGLSAAWLAIGLTIGAYVNYILVAPRLRVYTEKRMIQSHYLTTLHRLNDNSNIIKIISGGIIVVFFTLYTHSGMVSGGKLFNTAFGLDYHTGLILVSVIVIAYTFFGGYLAVSLTDFFQGVVMLIAMIMVPIVAMMQLGGVDVFSQAADLKPTNLDLFKGTTIVGIISFFAWGLGYFGQPHIIVRFMSIKSVSQLKLPEDLVLVGWLLV